MDTKVGVRGGPRAPPSVSKEVLEHTGTHSVPAFQSLGTQDNAVMSCTWRTGCSETANTPLPPRHVGEGRARETAPRA